MVLVWRDSSSVPRVSDLIRSCRNPPAAAGLSSWKSCRDLGEQRGCGESESHLVFMLKLEVDKNQEL